MTPTGKADGFHRASSTHWRPTAVLLPFSMSPNKFSWNYILCFCVYGSKIIWMMPVKREMFGHISIIVHFASSSSLFWLWCGNMWPISLWTMTHVQLNRHWNSVASFRFNNKIGHWNAVLQVGMHVRYNWYTTKWHWLKRYLILRHQALHDHSQRNYFANGKDTNAI